MKTMPTVVRTRAVRAVRVGLHSSLVNNIFLVVYCNALISFNLFIFNISRILASNLFFCRTYCFHQEKIVDKFSF